MSESTESLTDEEKALSNRMELAFEEYPAFAPKSVSTLEEARAEIGRLSFELLTLHKSAVEGVEREAELRAEVERLSKLVSEKKAAGATDGGLA